MRLGNSIVSSAIWSQIVTRKCTVPNKTKDFSTELSNLHHLWFFFKSHSVWNSHHTDRHTSTGKNLEVVSSRDIYIRLKYVVAIWYWEVLISTVYITTKYHLCIVVCQQLFVVGRYTVVRQQFFVVGRHIVVCQQLFVVGRYTVVCQQLFVVGRYSVVCQQLFVVGRYTVVCQQLFVVDSVCLCILNRPNHCLALVCLQDYVPPKYQVIYMLSLLSDHWAGSEASSVSQATSGIQGWERGWQNASNGLETRVAVLVLLSL